MFDVPGYMRRFFEKFRKPRYRDPRGYYPSSVLSDLRDQFWAAKGVPETDLPDVKSLVTMSIGNWVEKGLVQDVFQYLHFFGLHFIGSQIPVGGSNPNWDGYLDLLVCERQEDGKLATPVIGEIKTIHGYGADLLMRSFEVKDGYLLQLGLYLRDLAEKKNLPSTEGFLLHVVLSDANFGDLVVVWCKYDAETEKVNAFRVQTLSGRDESVSQSIDVKEMAIDRWKRLEKHVAENTCPPSEFFYKKPLTTELLTSLSDADLKKAISGAKIIGDWQVRYSRYFTRILEVDKVSRTYTDEEKGTLAAEYNRRPTPTGRKRKPISITSSDSEGVGEDEQASIGLAKTAKEDDSE